MRIIAISMVKNEMDLVESFVRHTLSFADGMLIANHGSTDRTGKILEALRKEGLPLQVFPHPSIAQDQGTVMTLLLRRALAELHADLVLPLDADEFLLRDGPLPEAWNPRPVLESLDPEKLYDVYLCDCEPKDMESGHDVFLLQRPYWRTRVKDLGDASDANRRKIIIGRGFAERMELRVTQGNHYGIVGREGPSCQSRVRGEHLASVYLAHFPCRGQRQYLSKVVVGWLGSVSETTRYTNMARHWQRQFDRFVRGEDDVLLHLDPAIREEVSPGPPKAAPQLRYTSANPGGVADVLREVAALGERLAHSYAEQAALSANPAVSVILPCWGGRDRLVRSLRSICGLDYANKELILMGPSDAPGMQELSRAASALPDGFTAVQRVGGPEELPGIAKGDYVQWVSPGDEVPKENLRIMLAIMEKMFGSFVCWNNGSRAGGGIDWQELIIQDISARSGQEALEPILSTGYLMSGGISGTLFRRKAMELARWMAPYLQGERWAEFRLWHDLLPQLPVVSLLCLKPVRREALTAEDVLWQQMDWMTVMEKDRRSGRLPEDQYRKQMQTLRQNLQKTGQG